MGHPRLIGDAEHFWQKSYYDFNIRNYLRFVEKLRYIHRNPVKAGLWRVAAFFTRAVTLKTKIIFNPGMAHLSRCSGGVVGDVAAV